MWGVCVDPSPSARGAVVTLDVRVAEALKAHLAGPGEPASCFSRSRHPRVRELAGWGMSGTGGHQKAKWWWEKAARWII